VYLGRLPIYLGHVGSDKGVAIDSKNIEVVVECPIPKDKTEVRSFLGLTNYYKCFVNFFVQTAKPLTDLLKGKNNS
jgi:hypothetical protein